MNKITVSAPAKVHLLGEHAAVYGKPALLTTVDLRVTVTISPSSIVIPAKAGIHTNKQSLRSNDLNGSQIKSGMTEKVKTVIETIVKKELKIKKIPSYNLAISSQIPIGAGLGSSAAVSAAYIAALIGFLKVKWDLNFINKLAYEAEKVFHGNPSGADNSTVVFGGLVWYRKENPDLKLIQQLPYSIPSKLSKNFVIINTGTPKEITKDMVILVKNLYDKKPKIVEQFLENQEKLVKELLSVIKEGNEEEFIKIIREGEKNLEGIGVVSKFAQGIIRKIEGLGGVAKISGAGGKTKAAGVLLCYHPDPKVLKNIAKSVNLEYFQTKLGVEGLKLES